MENKQKSYFELSKFLKEDFDLDISDEEKKAAEQAEKEKFKKEQEESKKDREALRAENIKKKNNEVNADHAAEMAYLRNPERTPKTAQEKAQARIQQKEEQPLTTFQMIKRAAAQQFKGFLDSVKIDLASKFAGDIGMVVAKKHIGTRAHRAALDRHKDSLSKIESSIQELMDKANETTDENEVRRLEQEIQKKQAEAQKIQGHMANIEDHMREVLAKIEAEHKRQVQQIKKKREQASLRNRENKRTKR
jgi:hypothetical protein